MKRLLEIELFKIFTNKSSRLLVFVYFGLLLSMALIAMIKFDLGPFKFHLAKQGIFDFPLIWHFNTYIASFLKIFLAIIIVSMVSNEYANKTIKQNLIDGLSKKEFILSKFYTVLLFSVVSTIFVVIISLVLGSIYSKEMSIQLISTDLQFILAYFINLVGFFTLCLFLGLLIKRSAFALGFLLLFYIIENMAYGMLRIPGLWTDEQISGWTEVASKVHANGGKIFAQIMHTGRASHLENMLNGTTIMAPSAVKLSGEIYTDSKGLLPYELPKEMSLEDIKNTQNEYVQAAINAIKAGFDGVEIHGANGYLIDQFLNISSNQRTDEYGGNFKNRNRFLNELLTSVVEAIGVQIGETMTLDYNISIINVMIVILWTIALYLLSIKLLESRDL